MVVGMGIVVEEWCGESGDGVGRDGGFGVSAGSRAGMWVVGMDSRHAIDAAPDRALPAGR